MASVSARGALRGMPFVDKENVLASKPKGDTSKKTLKQSLSGVPSAAAAKGGLGGGRAPLKVNVAGNVPTTSGLPAMAINV